MVTLVVGTQKARINCYKLMLGYFSGCFDAALFGQFEEAGKADFYLPEDEEQDIRQFVQWTYTGSVPVKDAEIEEQEGKTDLDLERACVLADKLSAPTFANRVIRRVMWQCRDQWLEPEAAEYVFKHTAVNSKLRLCVVDYATSEGLCSYSSPFQYQDQWLGLLSKGGDLVIECLKAGGFRDEDPEKAPWPKTIAQVSRSGLANFPGKLALREVLSLPHARLSSQSFIRVRQLIRLIFDLNAHLGLGNSVQAFDLGIDLGVDFQDISERTDL